MSLHVLVSTHVMRTGRTAFKNFLRGGSLLGESEQLGGDSPSSLYHCTVSISAFDAYATLYFLFFLVVSIFRLTDVAIGAINEQEVNRPFDNPSVASSVSKYFAICASSVLSMTVFRSKFNIIFSETFYTTGRTPFCAFWSVLHKAGPSPSSTIVAILLATSSFTVHFISSAITSSFSLRGLLIGRG